MKRILLPSIIALTSALLITFPEISSSAVRQALKLCSSAIVPSLFPFLILSNLCLILGYTDKLSTKLGSLMRKWFHLPGQAAPALLLGCLSGFPIGAKTAATLYTKGHLQKKDAEQLLLFCSNAGPAFIFGIIGNGVFQNHYIGALLWMIHMLSAIMTGILLRLPNYSVSETNAPPIESILPSYSSALVQAVSDAGNTVIQISVFITAFSVITGFLTAAVPSYFSNPIVYVLLTGILELSQVTTLLTKLHIETAFILSSVLLAWNGFCIHFQVLSITASAGLCLRKYFIGKFLHMALSFTISCIAVTLLPLGHSCITNNTKRSLCIIALAGFALLFTVIVKTTSRKEFKHRI